MARPDMARLGDFPMLAPGAKVPDDEELRRVRKGTRQQ
jgi:hypothetical protein